MKSVNRFAIDKEQIKDKKCKGDLSDSRHQSFLFHVFFKKLPYVRNVLCWVKKVFSIDQLRKLLYFETSVITAVSQPVCQEKYECVFFFIVFVVLLVYS